MNKRILVVDDDPGLRFILQELFEGEAYEVDTASDGIIALEKICSICGTYDAILLDMTMPRMNGLQMLQELYQQAWVGFPSIIVLSADEMALQQAAGMGVGHVLSKPFEVAALLALVAAVSSFSVMEHVC